MFLIDANVISELRAGKPAPSPAVRRWAASIPGNQLYLSAVSIRELETGVLLMERKDVRQGEILRSWLQGLLLPGRTVREHYGHLVRCDARP